MKFISRHIYKLHKQFLHVIMGAGKSDLYRKDWQSGNLGKSRYGHLQSKLIRAEVCGNPVKDDADACLMKLVHKVHEVCRLTVSGCGRIVACYLISPGAVKRVLRNTDKLDVGVLHLLEILNNPVCELPVSIETILGSVGMFHPGADVALVDCNGKTVNVLALDAVIPLLV